MQRRSLTTRGRLIVAFGLILGTTAVASLVLLRVTSRVLSALDEVARDQEADHAGFVLGALAREEYLHQAHIILTEDDSHLGHYRETVAAFEQAANRVEHAANTRGEKKWLAEIRSRNVRIHRRLEDEIRPAVARRDRALVRTLHDATEAEIDRIVHLSGDLSESFQRRIDSSIGRAHKVSEQAHQRALIAPLIVLALALGAGVWIMRNITTPLRALQRGVAAISSGGLSTRIVVERDDEFGRLAAGFNRMVAELLQQQERLVQSEKLAGLGRVAAGVAHELNNPLGVILGYVRILRRGPLDGSLAESIQIIEDEAEQCRRIVEGLRDHVRPLVLSPRGVEIGPLLTDTVVRMEPAASGVRLRIDVQREDLRVSGDPARLRQVIANLLRNAVEASPEGGEVRVHALREEEQISFSVSDQGTGILEEHRSRLFEPFFTTKDQGSGLGLSICDAIVRAHGGSIEVKSAPGGGTTFTVHLPAAPAEMPDEPPGETTDG